MQAAGPCILLLPQDLGGRGQCLVGFLLETEEWVGEGVGGED